LRLLDLYGEIRRILPQIRLELLTCEHPGVDWGYGDLDSIFDRIHRVLPEQFGTGLLDTLPGTSGSFDLVDLQYHQSGAQIGACRRRWPEATIIFSPMESMIRSVLKRTGQGNIISRQYLKAAWPALQEAWYLRKSDRVVFVSRPDMDAVQFMRGKKPFYCIPTCVSDQEFPKKEYLQASLERRVVVFVAYFGSRTNQEALEWYCGFVHPRLRSEFPDYVLRVVGRGLDTSLVRSCTGDGIEFLGPVDDIADVLRESDMGIAPAIMGAGVRGKIHQYAVVGLPCVASALASEGLDYVSGESILIAEKDTDFIEHCRTLLSDGNVRRKMGSLAKEVCARHYSWHVMKTSISTVYELDP